MDAYAHVEGGGQYSELKPESGISVPIKGAVYDDSDNNLTRRGLPKPNSSNCNRPLRHLETKTTWYDKWKMPFTLDNWRWGLQEALTISLLMWPCSVPKIDQMLFNGNSRWVVANATPVIEGTAGGTTRRMIDRVAGTFLAGLLVMVSISVTIGVKSERSDRWYCILALYIVISLSGFIYNWLLFALPTHPLIGITAAFMTPIILSGSVFTGNGVVYASWRSITVSFGVIVSGFISRYFLPRRARVDIINGLADILTQLSQTLEPLVELESGLVADASFFQMGNLGENAGFTAMFGKKPAGKVTGRIQITADNWAQFKKVVWKKLELCGKLTNDQLVMVNAARTEVSIRKKNAFFEDEHTEALVNIRTLFYHVASLFFLVETQVMGTTDFEDEDLLEEVEHWSRFGLLDIQGEAVDIDTPNGSFEQYIQLAIAKSMNSPGIAIGELQKAADSEGLSLKEPLQKYFQSDSACPDDFETPLSIGSPPISNESDKQSSSAELIQKVGSLPTASAFSRVNLSDEERIKADVNPTLHWVKLYGPTISLMVKHICRALKAAADGLRENTFPVQAELAMRKTADAIAMFHRQRAERQQATATFVEYAVHGRNSSRVAEDDPTFIARFEKMLGLSISEYDTLSDQGRATFWQSYWLLRDRLSTADTNVMTLFVAVRTAIAAVERLIQARRAKISRGEDLNDHLDMEKLEAQQQAAINKAGGLANFRGSIAGPRASVLAEK